MKKTINYLFVGFSALVALTLVQCSKSSSSLPAINGYNSSNDVASANLLANWTFDNTLNEVKSGTAPSSQSGNSYVTGRIGQALSLSSGVVNYPALSALGTATCMPSFTVSLWFQGVKNNQTNYTCLFALTQSVANQTDWNVGPVMMGIETGWRPATNDTLGLHPNFANYVGGLISHQDNIANGDFSDIGKKWVPVIDKGTWIHYVCVYDQTNSTCVIYANGVLVSNTNYATRYQTPTPMTITPPTMAIIGGVPNSNTGYANAPAQSWQGTSLTGTIDDIRVYSKALSLLEVGSLYQLGSAGR